MLACLAEQSVHKREVELALPCFDLLPGNGYQHRVGLKLLDRGPYLRQHAGIVARVVDLGPEDQVRAAVDEQRMAALAVDEAGELGRALPPSGGAAGQCRDG